MNLLRNKDNVISHGMILDTIFNIYDNELHAKRVLSLTNAVQGVLQGASLAIHAVGDGLSSAQGTASKHAIKQVDRLLSNYKVSLLVFFGYWIPYVIASRKEIMVAMDWTDFALDDQTTLSSELLTAKAVSFQY